MIGNTTGLSCGLLCSGATLSETRRNQRLGETLLRELGGETYA